jgi:hypothetical protein
MRKVLAISVVAALFVSSLALTVSADEHVTGLARAAEATMQGLEKSQGNAAEAAGRAQSLSNQGEKKTGRERAAQAISVALERENGNGNAFGRGYAAYIHQILIEGAISEELDQANHGQQVREMVSTFNELRRSQEPS